MTHARTWVHLEDIMFSEISQSHKGKYYRTPLTQDTYRSLIHGHRKWSGGYQGSGEGELLFNESRVLLCDMKRILWMNSGGGSTAT